MNDIRPYKNELRTKYRAYRRRISGGQKAHFDNRILHGLIESRMYREADTVLVYVSLPEEIDTFGIINKALEDGKRVAVPYCVPGTRILEFYFIDSADALSPGTFGVPEPDPLPERRFDGSPDGVLCIVPAFCFDREGYRLGYGKGYYDRFLSRADFETAGLCYDSCIEKSVPHGKYDRKVSYLITPKFILKTDNEVFTDE
ncbi:MAG: 5-formyltetrahydrofolate cyclo-ligase [Clostridia bacterium]|nr:5-formyltetrahydrofolate cyclo-ligase [Clostridia bacterium]